MHELSIVEVIVEVVLHRGSASLPATRSSPPPRRRPMARPRRLLPWSPPAVAAVAEEHEVRKATIGPSSVLAPTCEANRGIQHFHIDQLVERGNLVSVAV